MELWRSARAARSVSLSGDGSATCGLTRTATGTHARTRAHPARPSTRRRASRRLRVAALCRWRVCGNIYD